MSSEQMAANQASFTLAEIVRATGGQAPNAPDALAVRGVSTDTRALQEGALFVALRGENFDGHRFLAAAAKNGAAAALVEELVPDVPLPQVRVESTLAALGALAAAHRRRFAVPVVGVTGSYGKTTTRAFIAAALGAKYSVLSSQANFNNEIGVPQTLLQLNDTHGAAVIEMAMRGSGQIAYLAEMAQPNVAVITNIGPQHVELLGGIDNIARAKAEILKFLPEDGVAILSADDEYLDFFTDQVKGRTILRFGENPSAEFHVGEIRTEPDGHIRFDLTYYSDSSHHAETHSVRLPLPGAHNARNAAAALAVAASLDVPLKDAVAALAAVEVPDARMKIVKSGGLTIIDDCYNAGPVSMRAALETLRDFPGGKRRVAVLGSMKELGDWTQDEHRKIGALAAQCADVVLGVGTEAKTLIEAATEYSVITDWREDAASAAARARELTQEGDVVLVKGSRSVGLEAVVSALGGR
jgi:UDP-N-acetylmuramoyl-tripeptide--D-alanyl-D-alanine ligase